MKILSSYTEKLVVGKLKMTHLPGKVQSVKEFTPSFIQYPDKSYM